MVKNNPKGFFNVIKSSRCLAILCGVRTDPDAVGAGVGLKYYLEREGKKADIYMGRQPRNLLTSDISFRVKSAKRIDYSKYDAVIAVDASNASQNLVDYLKEGEFSLPEGIKEAAIDHHVGNSGYTKNIIFEKTSSTAELVYRYLLKGKKLPASVSTSLLQGIIADTGFFRWEIGDQTLAVCQDLINQGADFGVIVQGTFFNYRRWQLKALSYFLTKTKYDKKLGLSYFLFSQKDLKKLRLTRQQYTNIRPIYNAIFARAVVGYPHSLVFSKLSRLEAVSVSGRTNTYVKNPLDLTRLAHRFDAGGGHPGASGFFVKGSLAEAKKKVFAAVREMQKEMKVSNH